MAKSKVTRAGNSRKKPLEASSFQGDAKTKVLRPIPDPPRLDGSPRGMTTPRIVNIDVAASVHESNGEDLAAIPQHIWDIGDQLQALGEELSGVMERTDPELMRQEAWKTQGLIQSAVVLLLQAQAKAGEVLARASVQRSLNKQQEYVEYLEEQGSTHATAS